MKKEKSIKLILIVILLLLAIVIMTALIYRSSPYAYVKQVAKSNGAILNQLTAAMRGYAENNKHFEYSDEDAPEDIKAIMGGLKSEYQKDSEGPVFSGVEVYFDEQGDMMYLIQVRKDKLKSGDGKESPDIRCYYLIYTDSSYDGKQAEASADVIYGNWHYWSKNLYSG
ncbi:MAG: hypothetical protein K6B44_05690 [Lachnospiraceae bacterium]|nr:hypothetical protein [Lachnospiraceae bacterium]